MKKSKVDCIRVVIKWIKPHARLMARGLAFVTQHSLVADTLLARATVPFISAYRVLLSPHKGFLCAHGAVTGGPSCSDIALQTFKTTTFASAVVIVDKQFAKCRHAYLACHSSPFVGANNHLPSLSRLPDVNGIGFEIDCC